MLSRNLALPRLAVRSIQTSSSVSGGHHVEHWWGPEKGAGRELVGFGATGDNVYQDRLDYWYPAIRFRKEDDVSRPLRQKEQGDWKNLSLEDKKTLYRYSFRQTLAEFEAPNGYWKAATGIIFGVLSLATLYTTFLKKTVYPELPPTFQDEYKQAQVERMLVLEKGQFLGPAKHYDYENNKWK
ncbi:unnamed protein product [Auanema sp. JU1783]|nr:unnamed protein product [Auanema sp. JU1783]